MRTSVRSLRPWRIVSCPAANGIRCVKPSKAVTSPSRTTSSTAWARFKILAIRHSRAGAGGPCYGRDGAMASAQSARGRLGRHDLISDDDIWPPAVARPAEFFLTRCAGRNDLLQRRRYPAGPRVPHDQHAFRVEAGPIDPGCQRKIAEVEDRRPVLGGDADETGDPGIAADDAQGPAVGLRLPDCRHAAGNLRLRPVP